MARRRRSKSKRQPLDPVEVAEGHVHVRAEDLFDLVHEVNPTGLRLSVKEQTRRYELKSRLQSLLVLRFGDEWVDVAATDDAGVVSLNHRSGRRDACHAALSELEPEARSWIQRQLDLAASPEPEAHFDGTSSDAGLAPARPIEGSHLERGRQALDAYDYEGAEHHLRLAVDAERGFEAARCLLELWVDVLGMDAEALELEPRLPESSRAQPAVRTLLALAAARLGECERALALIEGLSVSGPGTSRARTAEVHAALAAAALREGDHEEARRPVAVLGELDPTHPEIPNLLDEIANLRAAELRVVEQDLERRYREAGCDGSEPEARAVLEQWPESELARRILRERAEQRRQADIAGHLERAAAAFDEERFDDAARHYGAAVTAGCDTEEVARRLEASRRRGRQQREQARLDEIVRLFEGHETREALVRYLGLPEDLKRRLKQRTHPPSLDWLDAMDGPPSGARAHAAAAAAVSLETARRMLARGDARAALDEVAPHLELLEGLDEGRRLSEEAREQLDARRREHTRCVLASALEAFRGGHTSRAGELLASIDLQDLDSEDRGKAEHLRADVEKANAREQLEQEYERFLASEDWMGALDRSRRRARLESDAEEQQRWRERDARLRRRIRETWRVECGDGAVALTEAQGIFLAAQARPPAVLLDEEGRHLALVNAWETWLFLRIVDLGSLEVVRRWSLRTPQPLESPIRIAWNGETVQVCGKRGGFVDVSPRTGDVLDWRPLESLATVSGKVTETLLTGSSQLWFVCEDRAVIGQGRARAEVFDLELGAVTKSLSVGKLPLAPGEDAEAARILPVFGGAEPAVVLAGSGRDVGLYSARGSALAAASVTARELLSAAVDPDGEGLVLVGRVSRADALLRREEQEAEPASETRDELAEKKEIFVTRFERRGRRIVETSSLRFSAALRSGANQVATALDAGLVFLLLELEGYKRTLTALRVSGGCLEPVYEVEVPYHTVLATDRASRRAVAVVSGESSIELHPLVRDAERPEPPNIDLPRPVAPEYRVFPQIDGPFTCWPNPVSGPVEEYYMGVLVKTMNRGVTEVRRQFAELLPSLHLGVGHQVYMCRTMRLLGFAPDQRESYIRELARKYPRHTGVLMLRAEPEADAGRWDEVLRILANVDIDLESDQKNFFIVHFYHLVGLAFLHLGLIEEAFKAFKNGRSQDFWGECVLSPLVELTTPMAEGSEEQESQPDRPLVRQLVARIRLAERTLAGEDFTAAREVLEPPVVWREVEVQTAARLAEAWLGLDAETPGQRFRKRLALAFFCHAVNLEPGRRREIVLPGTMWLPERLGELESRVRAWLERSSARNRGSS